MAIPTHTYDVVVAGTGMAGMATAFFAARAGLSVLQLGGTGEIVFTSGLIDVLGCVDRHPVDAPWNALEVFIQREPAHPYARLEATSMRKSIEDFLDWLATCGMPYRTGGDKNVRTITPMGTIKTTWAVPETMWEGVVALEERRPCLLVDFHGLREYSAQQIVDTLGDSWPTLRTARVEFPGTPMRPLLTGIMGQAMELQANRVRLVEAIKPHLGDATCVGLPAILGLYHPHTVLEELTALLGVPVFEIPTLPASVPGLRLKNLMEGHIAAQGVTLMLQRAVDSVTFDAEGLPTVAITPIGASTPELYVTARTLVLATGRFLGHGLYAERSGIRETILNLPLYQPEDRTQWHSHEMFDSKGHQISRAGVLVDDAFCPVDAEGSVVYPHVRAVGALLAHQDWMRQKCGGGLAIATAYAAIERLTSAVMMPK